MVGFCSFFIAPFSDLKAGIGLMSAVMRTNNQHNGFAENAEPFAMPSGERKSHSVPSVMIMGNILLKRNNALRHTESV